MEHSLYLSKTVVIKEGKFILNGETVFTAASTDRDFFIKELYHWLGLSYPKFFKMDILSKFAILAAEKLLEGKNNTQTALLFSNATTSLDFDIRHQKSIADKEAYYPSPAVFVYTLPNICIGEVSIKHQLLTESAFFVADQYDTKTMYTYTNYLLQHNKATAVVCGWINQLEDFYEIVMYLVEKDGTIKHSTEEINKIFN